MKMYKLALLVLGFLVFDLVNLSAQTLQTVTTNGATTDKTVELNNGGVVRNWNFTINGSTMQYRDPLLVNGNLDGAAFVGRDGALRFDRSSDIYENGNPSSVIMVYPASGIPYIRRYGHEHTIFKIWSPTSSRNAYESTLALVNGDEEEEFLDLYNLSYPSAKRFGIRMQRRGSGLLKPFHFEYSDGTTVYPVFTLSPDTSASFKGNVGIGTDSTKGYKLAVAGSMIAESVKVKHNSLWPDYVFTKNYRLRNLYEVASYVSKNKRLPEMPSGKEVHEGGINLGEMDARLLKKIEEITLYLIEQKKEIDQLKKDNKQLKASLTKSNKKK
ncbi:MAG: hypothetical protein ACOYVG_01120 [Bacteroidota bacterium]